MAIVQVDSQNITNVKTGVLNDNRSDGGRVRRSYACVSVTSGDSTGSVYRFVRVSSDSIIETMGLPTTSLTGLTGEDFGFYDINDGPVVNSNILIDGQSLSSASAQGINRLGIGNGFAIGDYGLQIWERLGLSADPHKEYDIALTLQNDASASGTVCIKLQFTDGS